VGVESFPVHDYAASLKIDLDRAGTDADEVLHAPSRITTVSTCAVCGKRSKARTARTR